MIKTITITGFLLSAVVFNANAQDTDRIKRLEKEVREINLRLSKLESLLSKTSKANEHVTPGEGWKSVMNWRKLTTDMDYSDVRKTLGEPHRVDGGRSRCMNGRRRGRSQLRKLIAWESQLTPAMNHSSL